MAYKNDSMLNNTARPMDFLYSRLATLSALQSYAATAGYYMSNHQHSVPTPSIPPLPSSTEPSPRHLERLQSVSEHLKRFKRCKRYDIIIQLKYTCTIICHDF